LTYRIQRLVEERPIVFVCSGELDADQCARLAELIAAEQPGRVRLDLKEVTLVDRSGVQCLVRIHAAGIPLVNCPDYVWRWIAAENGS
jgi:ABC-type transporter Mla MlaB component